MKYTRFRDIPQFTDCGKYAVDVGWDYLEPQLDGMNEGGGLNLDPDFQRAHVWTEDKQIHYIEFVLRGGRSSRDLFFNCPSWSRRGKWAEEQPIVLVDGKQRLEAARRFIRNEIGAFGSLYREFTDRMRIHNATFRVHVNDLQTRTEVLQWYLDLNTGGVVHTTEEIEKVRRLLEQENTLV
jgi:hypothetical protein